MIAQLGWYDRAETSAADDRYWALIRKHLGYGPRHLDRTTSFWDGWLDPGLIVSQTCGYPYRSSLHGKVQLVGTPINRLPGCPPGYYCSAFVACANDTRKSLSDFAGARLAYNDALSQSGWAGPVQHLVTEGIAISAGEATGSHQNSSRAVAEGRADLAGLDILSWDLIKDFDPWADQLRVLGHTPPTPAPPYVCSLAQDADATFKAIEAAIQDLSAADRALLRLHGLARIPPEEYLAVPTPAAPEQFLSAH